MALRIEDYAIIGDCKTAALVGRDGSIDWLCWPRFDSGACFAALLGTPDHGRWLIAPADPNARVTRHYRDDTLILETDFESPGGAATVIDFMPLSDDSHDLMRVVIGVRQAISRNAYSYRQLIGVFSKANGLGAHMANAHRPGILAVSGSGDVNERPSASSLAALDAINFFLAAAQSGFGAYVASFLVEQNWTPQNIGFVLTVATVAGLLSQMPSGELLDTLHSKRLAMMLAAAMISAAALVIALWPSFPVALTVLMIQAIAGGFLVLGIASVSLGLVGHAALGERLGRNQRFASAGGVFGAGLMGLVSYFLSYREIFLVAGALVLPLLIALSCMKQSDIHFETACAMPRRDEPGRPARDRRQSLWKNRALVIFACAVFLFQLANASMLPLAAGALAYTKSAGSPLVISALIVVPQVIVVLMAPWVGRQAKTLGRRPLLLAGFAALPLRALIFASTEQSYILITAQLLDGISGAVLGVLTALTVADVTAGSGRFNLALGVAGTMSGLGASISTTLFGQIVGNFGPAAAFLSIAAVSIAAVLLLWLLMPETSTLADDRRDSSTVQTRDVE